MFGTNININMMMVGMGSSAKIRTVPGVPGASPISPSAPPSPPSPPARQWKACSLTGEAMTSLGKC